MFQRFQIDRRADELDDLGDQWTLVTDAERRAGENLIETTKLHYRLTTDRGGAQSSRDRDWLNRVAADLTRCSRRVPGRSLTTLPDQRGKEMLRPLRSDR